MDHHDNSAPHMNCERRMRFLNDLACRVSTSDARKAVPKPLWWALAVTGLLQEFAKEWCPLGPKERQHRPFPNQDSSEQPATSRYSRVQCLSESSAGLSPSIGRIVSCQSHCDSHALFRAPVGKLVSDSWRELLLIGSTGRRIVFMSRRLLLFPMARPGCPVRSLYLLRPRPIR